MTISHCRCVLFAVRSTYKKGENTAKFGHNPSLSARNQETTKVGS